MQKTKTMQLVILLLVATVSGSALTYALTVYWNAPVKITIEKSVNLGVFSDSACTNQVAQIDFGSQKAGAYAYKELYLKNTGNANVTLSWTSDAPKTILAGDDWVYSTGSSWTSINGYTLKPDEVLKTKYEVFVLPNANSGSFSWNLQLESA